MPHVQQTKATTKYFATLQTWLTRLFGTPYQFGKTPRSIGCVVAINGDSVSREFEITRKRLEHVASRVGGAR